MKTHPMKLVTVICEALAREPLKALLADSGARGYTMFAVAGSGAHGERAADIEEYGNVQAQAIVPPDVAERLLQRLQTEFFPRFTMVAYESDVRVLRSDKF